MTVSPTATAARPSRTWAGHSPLLKPRAGSQSRQRHRLAFSGRHVRHRVEQPDSAWEGPKGRQHDSLVLDRVERTGGVDQPSADRQQPQPPPQHPQLCVVELERVGLKGAQSEVIRAI